MFALVAAVTPGPSNIIVTAAGARVGILRGLPCFLGVVLGMGAMMSLVALGFGGLIVGNPEAARIIQFAGAGFLLWLAWKTASAGGGSGGSGDPAQRDPVGFLGAAAFQWINPKSWLVSTSAAATFLAPEPDRAMAQALLFGGLFIAAAAPSCFLWLAFGAAMQRFLKSSRARRVFNLCMGLILAGSVIPFVL